MRRAYCVRPPVTHRCHIASRTRTVFTNRRMEGLTLFDSASSKAPKTRGRSLKRRKSRSSFISRIPRPIMLAFSEDISTAGVRVGETS